MGIEGRLHVHEEMGLGSLLCSGHLCVLFYISRCHIVLVLESSRELMELLLLPHPLCYWDKIDENMQPRERASIQAQVFNDRTWLMAVATDDCWPCFPRGTREFEVRGGEDPAWGVLSKSSSWQPWCQVPWPGFCCNALHSVTLHGVLARASASSSIKWT